MLVLASGSPRRRELLRAAGVEFETVVADVVEVASWADGPREMAMHNAGLKAHAVSKLRPEAVVLGADTIVVFAGEVFGKPSDIAEARSMLGRLQGRTHEVITGVVLRQGMRCRQFCEVTRVQFRPLDAVQIDAYLERIHPLDKAGAYAAQDDNGEIIQRVEGDFDNVVGLPLRRTLAALATFGEEAGPQIVMIDADL